jgi:hypothetical protein
MLFALNELRASTVPAARHYKAAAVPSGTRKMQFVTYSEIRRELALSRNHSALIDRDRSNGIHPKFRTLETNGVLLDSLENVSPGIQRPSAHH